jgi:NAD(P)-dependent dehydrogenase (short-subunit alcohol dehydrogenase family)
MESQKPVAVVAGAGPGNCAALARRFVGAGYATAILSRHRSTLAPIENELATARGFECDVGDPVSVESTFARIRSELGEVDETDLLSTWDTLRAPISRHHAALLSGGDLVKIDHRDCVAQNHPPQNARAKGVGPLNLSRAIWRSARRSFRSIRAP